MIDRIRAQLEGRFDAAIVDELLTAYVHAKRHYYAGDHRQNAVEGGRFCEAAFRILQQAIDPAGTFTPIGSSLPSVDKMLHQLENHRGQSKLHTVKWQQDSVGLHIPRALRVIYNIRNQRDAAHLADGIDPNKQDATLVVSTMDWVVAEFVRLYHNVPANEAFQLVQGLVSPKVPAIQEFDGEPMVLNRNLNCEQCVLLLLYRAGSPGAQWHQLYKWIPTNFRRNLQSTLDSFESTYYYVRFNDSTGYYTLTATGIKQVHDNKFADPVV
jgi:hypothetical protein